MEALRILFYVLLFAVITAFLYAWGLWRAGRKQQDLLIILQQKGARRILRALKSGPKTKAELVNRLKGLKASLFYSRRRVKVQEPEVFAGELLEFMVQKGLIQQRYEKGRREYSLPTDDHRPKG